MASNKKYNFDGKILNVTVNHAIPFCDVSVANAQERQLVKINYSLEMNLLRLLEEKLQFSANIISGKQEWPMRINGSWNDVVANIVNKTVDFAMCDISITQERLQVTDFSRVTHYNEIGFISRRPQMTKPELIAAAPFSLTVWVLILCLSICVLWAARLSSPHSTLICALSIVAITLKQQPSIPLNSKHPSAEYSAARLIYATWMLASLILANAYSSAFYSILTVPYWGSPVDTIEDILEISRTDSHNLLVKENSEFFTRFLNAPPEDHLFYQIGQHMHRTRKKLSPNDNEIEIAQADPKNVVISSKLSLVIRRYLFENKPLHIGAESIGPDFTAIMMRKGSPLIEQFNIIIVRAHECGLFNKWMQTTLVALMSRREVNFKFESQERAERKIFTLTDLRSIFAILLVGLEIGTSLFVIEILYTLCCLRVQYVVK